MEFFERAKKSNNNNNNNNNKIGKLIFSASNVDLFAANHIICFAERYYISQSKKLRIMQTSKIIITFDLQGREMSPLISVVCPFPSSVTKSAHLF